MDIEYIREFVTLGKELNFTTASRILNVTQPTLSRHTSAIEKDLGTPLFERTPMKVSLTAAGRVFLESSINLIHDYDEMRKLAITVSQKEKTKLNIGGNFKDDKLLAYATACITYLMRKDMPFKLEFYDPHVSLSHEELASHDPIESLGKEKVDLLLILARDGYDWGSYASEELYHSPFVAYVSEKHPLARQSNVSLIDLKGYHFVKMNMHNSFGEGIIDACRAAGFEPQIKIRVFQSEPEMFQVHDNQEILCLPEGLVGRIPPTAISGLVQLDLYDEEAYMYAWAVYDPEKDLDAKKAVVKIFKEVVDKIFFRE